MKPATTTTTAAHALALLPFLFLLAPAQTVPDIGSGPVSETIRREFLRAYYRASFQNLTSLPPLGDVRRLGTTGLVQEFPDAAKTNNVRYALVRANSLNSTVQEGADTSADDARSLHRLHPLPRLRRH